ncbi:hypothetical protein TPSD3_05420 [Thioflexithrix psekupsensis]|uniref:Guanylate cyclase domain-containing protein n=2 Tax=Thioflexithrix psekupsensis TaxID=1570016 RepID=A0A251X7Y8_9GAMM|nr:hypothetical protein TPSD3_05420 [Thioflexithrix psekupsensis]
MALDLEQLNTGIDNVHIDVTLDPQFCRRTLNLIDDLLKERSTNKRRFSDQPSTEVQHQLEQFGQTCSHLLINSIYQARQTEGIVRIRLLELSLIKFILENVQARAEQLLQSLRHHLLDNETGGHQAQQHYERSIWLNNNYNRLLQKITSDLFNQLYWAEMGEAKILRQNLFGQSWSLPIDLLSNPVLQNKDWQDHDMLVQHYCLLSSEMDHPYSYACLNERIDVWLELILEQFPVKSDNYANQNIIEMWEGHLLQFTWKDVNDNIQLLFHTEATQQQLEENPERKELKSLLQHQQNALKFLSHAIQEAGIAGHILAAYETPTLSEQYAQLIKPYVLYQTLCGELNLDQVWYKLQLAEKTRPLRRASDKPLSKTALQEAWKKVNRQQKQLSPELTYQFILHFTNYRRDLKQRHLIHREMSRLRLLTQDNDIKLSRANRLLYEFLEQQQTEPSLESDMSARGHVILKADVRGSTTITAELRKRGLNPATHFSRTFFDPIRQHIETFGAEKVFIEGDAVILSVFEQQSQPQHWLSVARACGLGRAMLSVVEAQNRFSVKHQLPILELGIGICYNHTPPDFLYDGDQRIMISTAIGDADRLSSCSWKLRRYFSSKNNVLTRVMVFQQAEDDKFKGEKGMVTFRYNLNGIELDDNAFVKLSTEIALKKAKLKLPYDFGHSVFFVGRYTDRKNNYHQLIIRQARVCIWRENSEVFKPTDNIYYEVVTHPRLINAFKNF